MCGIIGYVGRRDAAPILVEGLHRLEYRGYDSAGVAVQNGAGVVVTKLAGRVAALQALLERGPLHGTSGIAHTRWATHGAPTTRNAHPHTDCSGAVALVHNGIIENADALRSILEQPDTVRATLRGRLLPDVGSARLNGLNLPPEDCLAIHRIVIVACGTSWHAALVGRDLIEELAGIPVQVEYASEYRYRRPLV